METTRSLLDICLKGILPIGIVVTEDDDNVSECRMGQEAGKLGATVRGAGMEAWENSVWDTAVG